MKFKELAEYFGQIEITASRNKMMEILADLLNKARVDEADKISYLSMGRLVPLYESLEFNMAEKMVIKALAHAFSKRQVEVLGEYKKVGDLGEVAEKLKTQSVKRIVTSQSLPPFVLEVYKRLRKIAEESGEGSQDRKILGLVELLHELDALSVKYIVRIVLGRLRLGFSDKTILDALSYMRRGSKEGRKELDVAYQVSPDIGNLAVLVKKYGIKRVTSKVKIKLGIPVMPALCQRLKTAEEMIKKMGRVVVEPKYDGTRVQIHYRKGAGNGWQVRTFTRNLDESSHMFPELGDIGDQIDASDVILDSEAVGVDPKTKKLLPFQVTITRKRKHQIQQALTAVPLKFFVFDILYKDGKELIDKPLRDRRKLLLETIKGKGSLVVSDEIVTEDPAELRDFHGRQLKDGLEGVVIKKMDSPYEPGRQGWNWVKFKQVEEAHGKLADTLDCVVMGYYRGRGKRASFGLGAFLVGVKDRDKFLTIAKIGTGLSDKQWKEIKERVKNHESGIMNKCYVVCKDLEPDVWVDPYLVVEIAADEITKSPTHSAKLALRFPRLVRFRDDKGLGQATTIKEVKKLFQL